MAIEVFNRYENKYLIDKETYLKIKKVLDEHMVMDSYNPDAVSSPALRNSFDEMVTLIGE